MKTIIVNNWTNPDMRGVRTYVTSYTVRDEDNELYSIDLNKQMGFYQISEFVAVNGSDHFIIEQTNRVGAPKIAAFDKDTGRMFGTFKANNFVDNDENLIFSVESVTKLKSRDRTTSLFCNDDDFVALAADKKRVIALFCHLPRKTEGLHLLTRLKQSLINLAKSAPRDIFEIIIKDEHCCDHRMLAAIAVIIHNRGGLQVENKSTCY